MADQVLRDGETWGDVRSRSGSGGRRNPRGQAFRSRADGFRARRRVYICKRCHCWHELVERQAPPVACLDCGGQAFHKFPSKTEAGRFPTLVAQQRAGKISQLSIQPVFPIEHQGILICTVHADFAYHRSGKYVVEDVKARGAPLTPDFKKNRKLVRAFHGVEIQIIER